VTEAPRVIGRYALHQAIAAGGMATVHFGRLLGPVGFSRTVAIKRLHPQFASDPEFVSMFLDEARLAARIRHPNVVPTLDVVATGGELFLVMEYVAGESVARLLRAVRTQKQMVPLRVIAATMAGALHGLHAAHEAKDERGEPLGIVHRDVSPQNILLGADGVPRVLDFGVAKAIGRVQTTQEGQLKGKLGYMAPEQLQGQNVQRQTDIYAAGVVLWELIAGQRLFWGDNQGAVITKVLAGKIAPPSTVFLRQSGMTVTDATMRTLEALDRTALRALEMDPARRFASARDMALEIERRCPPAPASECGDWVDSIARDVLASRAAMVGEIESQPSSPHVEDPVKKVLDVPPSVQTLALQMTATLPFAATPAPGDSAPRGYPGLSPPLVHSTPHLHEVPPITQPSSISVSRPMPEAERGMRRAVATAVACILLGSALLGGAIVYRRSTASALAVAAQPTIVAVPTPIPVQPVVAPPPAAVDTRGAEPTPAVPSTIASAPAPRPTQAPTRKPYAPVPTKPAAVPTAQDDCTTPYWFDANGVKKYKEHCFGK
jgi:eukaryotic-like serine/threonine-protein kinase